MMRAEDVIRRLGEDGRAGLAELRHAVVEEVGIHVGLGQAVGPHISLRLLRAGYAVPMVLGNLRGKLVVEVVLVERVGHAAVLRPAMAKGNVVEVRQIEVVEVVEVDQIAKVLIARSVHARPRLRICTLHCIRRGPASKRAGGKSLDLRNASNFLAVAGGAAQSASGGIASKVKTLDALLGESTVVSGFTSLGEGLEGLEDCRTAGLQRQTLYRPEKAMRTRADLLWWAREHTPRRY